MVYVSTYQERILKSTNGGRSWFPASSGLPTNINESVFEKLYSDPTHPGTVYAVSVHGQVFVTRDRGSHWQPFVCPAAPSAIAFDPENNGTMYTGTEGQGVLRSTDGGEHWN